VRALAHTLELDLTSRKVRGDQAVSHLSAREIHAYREVSLAGLKLPLRLENDESGIPVWYRQMLERVVSCKYCYF